jgi:hypothetical protein
VFRLEKTMLDVSLDVSETAIFKESSSLLDLSDAAKTAKDVKEQQEKMNNLYKKMLADPHIKIPSNLGIDFEIAKIQEKMSGGGAQGIIEGVLDWNDLVDRIAKASGTSLDNYKLRIQCKNKE